VAPVPRKRAFAAARRPPSPDGVSNEADENGDATMSTTGIPIPGTPAYWTAQREAVALVHAWQHTELGADEELDLLRRIAAHGFASRMMAAHGANVARWVAILETLRELFEDDDEEDEDEDADPDGPPHGQDWCRRGCQILYGWSAAYAATRAAACGAARWRPSPNTAAIATRAPARAPRASAACAAWTPRRPTARLSHPTRRHVSTLG